MYNKQNGEKPPLPTDTDAIDLPHCPNEIRVPFLFHVRCEPKIQMSRRNLRSLFLTPLCLFLQNDYIPAGLINIHFHVYLQN